MDGAKLEQRTDGLTDWLCIYACMYMHHHRISPADVFSHPNTTRLPSNMTSPIQIPNLQSLLPNLNQCCTHQATH
jgi:hypothetical protein